MAIKPVARFMLLCDDYRYGRDRRLTAVGLLSTIHVDGSLGFPAQHDEFCIVLGLSGGRGEATGQIIGVFEETGRRVFGTRPNAIRFGPDPLAVEGVTFRVQGAVFHDPGAYLIQFWYDGEMIEERTLIVR